MIVPLQIIHRNWCVLRSAHSFGPIWSLIPGIYGGTIFMICEMIFVTGVVQPGLLHQSDTDPFRQSQIAIPMTLLSLTISIVIAIQLNRYSKRKSYATSYVQLFLF
jgi:hypothetical protein